MKTNYTVIDLETSIKNRGDGAIGKNKADPFVPENKIVWVGTRTNSINKTEKTDTYKIEPDIMLVGQNIKFDLHYLMRDEDNRTVLPTCSIWDTQLAEYILTGQQVKMISLDKLAEKYGGTLKDDKIKEYWDCGVETEDIPDSEIEPYLIGDLENTDKVFREQIKRAQDKGLLPLISSQMEALLATTEMEYNGMYFSKGSAMSELTVLLKQKMILEKDIVAAMRLFIPAIVIPEPNVESKDHLSAFLFGGELKYTNDKPVYDDDGNVVRYKTGLKKGLVKTKRTKCTYSIDGITVPKPEWETKKAGVYKTDEEVLSELRDKSNPFVAGFCDDLLRFRNLSKEVGTYYGPYINLVHEDACIHGRLIHTNTNTGRLSSQSPNLQNITNKD